MMTISSSLSNVGVSALMAFGVTMLVGTILTCAVAGGVWIVITRPAGSQRPSQSRTALCSNLLKSAFKHCAKFADLATGILPAMFTVVALGLTLCPVIAVSTEAFRLPFNEGRAYGFGNFVRLAHAPYLLSALENSATAAAIVALVSTFVGFLLSLTSWDRVRSRVVLLAMLVLALLPGEIFALGLLQVAKLLGFVEGSAFLAGIAQAVWVIPFATGSLMVANSAVVRSLVESALELGRTPQEVAREVIARVNLPAIAASAMLSFTLVLNENTRASYLGGSEPGLANKVFGRLQAGLFAEGRAIFALEFVLVLTALVSSQLIVLVLLRTPKAQS